MSDVFFRELDLPTPDVNLGVGSGTHAEQTAATMVGLEREWTADPPALVVVYGDVNGTLAASLVAAKLGVPSAHVEAGLRSFDRSMPEEINRIVYRPARRAPLHDEPRGRGPAARRCGVPAERIRFVGNPDDRHAARAARSRSTRRPSAIDWACPTTYGVVTLHRPSNVDDVGDRAGGRRGPRGVAALVPLVIPLHPRGRATLEAAGLRDGDRLRIVEPLGYVAFLSLVAGARLVLTDSGGIQEETTILDVPCLTMRPNTERPITVSHGTNRLVAPSEVVAAAREILAGPVRPTGPRPPLWDGHAGERIADEIVAWLRSTGAGPVGATGGAAA